MSVDDPVFDKVIEHFPCDDLWDMGDLFEAGFANAGLKRFDINYVNSMRKSKTDDIHKQETTSGTNRNAEAKSIMDNTNGIVIKLEVKEHADLKAKMKIVKDADPKMSKVVRELKTLKATLDVHSKPESRDPKLPIKHKHQHNSKHHTFSIHFDPRSNEVDDRQEWFGFLGYMLRDGVELLGLLRGCGAR